MSAWSRRRYAISLDHLVERIEEELTGRAGWLDLGPDTLPRALQYHYRLEALVNWLECYDCGSTGGFGADKEYGLPDLIARAEWLIKKYRASR